MKLSEELAWRGFVHQTTFKDLKELDKQKRTFYWGCDPSSDSLTVGNLAAAMMTRKFIQHGFTPIILIGGATGMVGDPKDDEERQLKTLEEIDQNKKGIAGQYSKIFDGLKIKIVDNYDWFKNMNYLDFLRDIGKYTSLSQMLDREFVKARVGKDKAGLSYAEFSYALIQGYDFLHLYRNYKVTLQLCGSDQWGNSIAGVDLIRRLESAEAHIYSTPLIINKATGKKFGKSEEGAIWLDPNKTSVFKYYQFWLNVDDEGVGDYIKIYTEVEPEEFTEIMSAFKKDKSSRLAQKYLAYESTKIVHGVEAADRAKKLTEVLFEGKNVAELSEAEFKELANELPTSSNKDLVEFMLETNLADSKSSARRLIEQGGIEVNGQKATINTVLSTDSLVKKGKNNFAIKIS